MGEFMLQGLQGVEDFKFVLNFDSEFGYLDFFVGFMFEIVSLGMLIWNDVWRCLCIVFGGVYENVFFFFVIQLLKNWYLGVKIDVMVIFRGKQVSCILF